MAGESSIDTGINVGEAQVFRPYNDQGLTGQAEIGIEQDKLNRKAAAQKEKEKQLKDANIDIKGDGLVPALSNTFIKSYKDINQFSIDGFKSGLGNDYDFNNKLNGEKSTIVQYVSDNKEYSKYLAAIQKLSLEGKLDDESQDIFDNILMNPKYWDDMQAKGASLPEISGAYSAALKSVKEKPAIEDWTKKIPRTLDFTGKSSVEDPKTGKTISSNYFDKKLAADRAKKEIKTLTPGEYAKAMLDFGSPENFENYLVETWKTNFNRDYSERTDNSSKSNINFGDGSAIKDGLLLSRNDKNPLEFMLGSRFGENRDIISFSYVDKNKMNSPFKFYIDSDKEKIMNAVPIGIERKPNGEYDFIVAKEDPRNKETGYTEARVPVKENMIYLKELKFDKPQDLFDYVDNKSIQEGVDPFAPPSSITK